MTENIAKENCGSYITERYSDILKELTEPNEDKENKKEKEKNEKLADNIIANTIARCGLKLKKT